MSYHRVAVAEGANCSVVGEPLRSLEVVVAAVKRPEQVVSVLTVPRAVQVVQISHVQQVPGVLVVQEELVAPAAQPTSLYLVETT